MILAEKKHLTITSEPDLRSAVRVNTAAQKCKLLSLLILACFAVCLLYTYQTTRIIALSYQAEKVQQNVAELQRDNKRLELKIAELQAPERVEMIARTKFGMKEPDNFLIVSYTLEQPLQEPQTTPSPKSDWKGRLLAAIPQFTGWAEASPR